MNVCADSSAFVAIKNSADPNHEAAYKIFTAYAGSDTGIITSNFIIAESVTVISQKVSHKAAIEFREQDLAGIQIVRITEELEEHAFEIFRSLTSKNVSFIDCTSFALMRSLGLTTAFSFDEHFVQQGFKLLR
jgi:predicted nucleic acid-binding protein